MTDAELIARAVVGDDRHAYAELVRRHQSAVRACLRRLTAGNHALADDLAQETFVLAWRNLKSFRQEARFSTWLYRIATNCWLADARKRKETLLGDADADVAEGRRRRRHPRGRRRAGPRTRRRAQDRHGARDGRALRGGARRDRAVLP
ncbi:MAG: sigma-70 family RNA polymerase sigma factor [Betaproteobacteria bacterium]|nr:sigma-70 family RNA polymerase sigma factor [Betaproteobacteria bacterium]